MAASRARVRKIHDEPGLSRGTRTEVLKYQKYGTRQRNTGTNLKELPVAKAGTI